MKWHRCRAGEPGRGPKDLNSKLSVPSAVLCWLPLATPPFSLMMLGSPRSPSPLNFCSRLLSVESEIPQALGVD